MTKVFLPRITAEMLGLFFQATAAHAPADLSPSIVPVFVKEHGRRFNLLLVEMRPGFSFSRCERAEEVNRDGSPVDRQYGYYRLVPAENITRLRYLAKGCEVLFSEDGEGSFVAITNRDSVGPVIAKRIEAILGRPLESWHLL